MAENRILTNELLEEDKIQNIRPETLDEYIGQSEVKENIRVFEGFAGYGGASYAMKRINKTSKK